MFKKLTVVSIFVLLSASLFTFSHYSSHFYNHSVLSAFQRTDVKKVTVTSYALNVRAGKGTQFPILTTVYKGQVIDVIGKLDNWYIIHLDNDMVGAISGNYATPVTTTVSSNPSPSSVPSNAQLSSEQSQMLALVNQERSKAGVKPLSFDSELARVATIKAQDMVDNNYFDHNSPTYGSPFDMMKAFGIHYTYAGENLAGYSTVAGAHNGLMNSEGHRRNILDPNFTNIGIGVVKSPKYGYIFVQMFIGR